MSAHETWSEASRAGRLPHLAGLLDGCAVDGYEVDFVSWGFYDASHPWRNYWHSHSFYEVCLAFSGRGIFRCDGRTLEVGAGEVFLARPGVVHEIESAVDTPLGIAFWGFTVQAPQRPDGGPSGWSAGLTTGSLASRRVGNLGGLLRALADEAAAPRSGGEAICAALGAALVVETARAFASEGDLTLPPRVRDRGSQVVAAMLRHLRDNLSRPLSVRDVAAVVHLSERHAERLYAEQTGESLMVTLRHLRLDLAGRQLLDSTRSTQEIAHACGYRDLSAFRLAFRRHHGQSPQAFRASGGTLQFTPMGADASSS